MITGRIGQSNEKTSYPPLKVERGFSEPPVIHIGLPNPKGKSGFLAVWTKQGLVAE